MLRRAARTARQQLLIGPGPDADHDIPDNESPAETSVVHSQRRLSPRRSRASVPRNIGKRCQSSQAGQAAPPQLLSPVVKPASEHVPSAGEHPPPDAPALGLRRDPRPPAFERIRRPVAPRSPPAAETPPPVEPSKWTPTLPSRSKATRPSLMRTENGPGQITSGRRGSASRLHLEVKNDRSQSRSSPPALASRGFILDLWRIGSIPSQLQVGWAHRCAIRVHRSGRAVKPMKRIFLYDGVTAVPSSITVRRRTRGKDEVFAMASSFQLVPTGSVPSIKNFQVAVVAKDPSPLSTRKLLDDAETLQIGQSRVHGSVRSARSAPPAAPKSGRSACSNQSWTRKAEPARALSEVMRSRSSLNKVHDPGGPRRRPGLLFR